MNEMAEDRDYTESFSSPSWHKLCKFLSGWCSDVLLGLIIAGKSNTLSQIFSYYFLATFQVCKRGIFSYNFGATLDALYYL